jgi:hypothetical protein
MPNIISMLTGLLSNTEEKEARKNAPIPMGATNLTVATTLVAAIGLLIEPFTNWIEVFLGKNPSTGARTAFAIALLGALAVVYAADLLARAYASAHQPSQPVKALDGSELTVRIPAEEGTENEQGWRIINVSDGKLLVIKKGKPPRWEDLANVRGE